MANSANPSVEDLEKWTRAARVKAENPSLTLKQLAKLLPIVNPKDHSKTTIPATTTVDNWIKAAADLGILEYKVVVPPDVWAEKRIERLFKHKIPNVAACVVPNGADKNLENLSQRAATVLLESLCDIDKATISVVLACGDTVRRTIHELFVLLDQEPALKKKLSTKKLTIYPASIHADYLLSPVYPCAAVALFDVLAAETIPTDMVKAFTPNLPQAFYEQCTTPAKISRYCKENGLQPIIDRAKQADIFVLGLGSTSGNNYRSILDTMDGALEDTSRIKDDIAELLFVPLNENSDPDLEISQRIVGVVPQDLRQAVRDGRRVLGVFGGNKDELVNCLVKSEPYMNVYITDSKCAQKMIDASRPN